MFGEISEEAIYRQLRGNYSSGILLLAIGGVVFLAGGVFCGLNLGWTNLITIIFLILLASCIAVIVVLAVKMSQVVNNPALIRHGGAAKLAERINKGLMNPRYIAHSLDGNHAVVTLIGDDYIVAGNEWTSLTNLKDIRTIQPTYIPEVIIIRLGNPLMTAGSLAANAIGDAYWESKGLNENTKFDYLVVTDSLGKTWRFGVQHQDMEWVLNYLLEAAPQMKFIR